jgi:ubiquinone/menaquinone biosynthesis C-methylase UbiE
MQADSKLFKEIVVKLDAYGKTILDVGTGTGFVLDNFDIEANFIILDISTNMLTRNIKKHNNVLLGLRADAEQIPVENDSVDIVTMSSVLHHLPNPSAALNEIHRVLRPSGKLLIFHEPVLISYSFVYKAVRKIIHLITPTPKNNVQREDKIKEYAKQIFGVEKEQAFKKMEDCNKSTTAQAGFDPLKLLSAEHFSLIETKNYYTRDTLFCRLMKVIFPTKSGDQFYIIARKK